MSDDSSTHAMLSLVLTEIIAELQILRSPGAKDAHTVMFAADVIESFARYGLQQLHGGSVLRLVPR